MSNSSINWLGSRESGLERLSSFLELELPNYQNRRNYDVGNAKNTVSGLSPYISRGLIAESEIIKKTLSNYKYKKIEKFIDEIFWRVYWKGWLELHPEVWVYYQSSLKATQEILKDDQVLNEKYNKATEGSTGIICFDYWTNQLKKEGYLHNHARMWFASIWIFTLELPWQLGADFFYRNLLDADPASNTLSWRWVAGLQTKGKHYLAAKSNIHKFTEGKFSPDGLNENAHPITENLSFEINVTSLKKARKGSDMKVGQNIVILEEDVLDDLTCNSELTIASSKKICVITSFMIQEQFKVKSSSNVNRFSTECLNDLEKRLIGLGIKEENLKICKTVNEAIPFLRSEDWYGIKPSIGYYHDLFDISEFKSTEMKFNWKLRDITLQSIPHSGKGFFNLKSKIPTLLESLI